MEQLLGHFGGKGKIWVILDNTRVHHAKALRPFLDDNKDKLELIFLPPYSPDLNPIERVWRFLRREKLHNTCYPTFELFQSVIVAFGQKYACPNETITSLCTNA